MMGFTAITRTQVPAAGRTASVWNRDIDISAIAGVAVPAGATSVLVECLNAGSTDVAFGVQGSDETTDQVIGSSWSSRRRNFVFVPLNASRTLDFYGTGEYYIVGFSSDITFIAAANKSSLITSTSLFTVACAELPAEAAFALVRVVVPATNAFSAKIGPVSATSTQPFTWSMTMVNDIIVPLNANKEFEYQGTAPDGTTNQLLVIGWLPEGAFVYNNAPSGRALTSGTVSTWQPFPETQSCELAMFRVGGGSSSSLFGVRGAGSSFSAATNPKNNPAYAVPGSSDNFEYYSSAVENQAFLYGYFPIAGTRLQFVVKDKATGALLPNMTGLRVTVRTDDQAESTVFKTTTGTTDSSAVCTIEDAAIAGTTLYAVSVVTADKTQTVLDFIQSS